jgi:hypothetical protein
MDTVVRRALQLEAESSRGSGDVVSQAELVRIGQELGLDPAHMRRAMAEVRNEPDEGPGLLRAMGVRFPRGQRVVERPADATAGEIEQYLAEVEQMVPERRLADRTVYLQDRSIGGILRRAAASLTRPGRRLGVERLDVTVTPLDEERALVDVAADLRGVRLGLTIAAVAIGLPLSVVAFAVNSITDPWILLGVVLLLGPWFFFRAIYGTVERGTREKVEALLDRIVHDDLE